MIRLILRGHSRPGRSKGYGAKTERDWPDAVIGILLFSIFMIGVIAGLLGCVPKPPGWDDRIWNCEIAAYYEPDQDCQ